MDQLSKTKQPLTVISSKSFRPNRDTKKDPEPEIKSEFETIKPLMTAKSFYPVRVERKKPAFFASAVLQPVKTPAKKKPKPVVGKQSKMSGVKRKRSSVKSPKTKASKAKIPKAKPSKAKSPKSRNSSKPKKKRGKFDISDDSENSDVENNFRVKLEEDDDDESSENSGSSDAEIKTEVKSEVKSEEASEDDGEDDDDELTYDKIRERNIENRRRLFNELQLGQVKSELASSLQLDSAKPSKPSKRGLASVTREREPLGPPRKSLRLQKIDAEKLELPEKEPTSYFVPTVEDRPRPPLAELEVSDVADWKHNHGDEESAKVVTEKSHFLKDLTSNLRSEYTSDKKPSFEGDFEKNLKKVKITEDRVAKVTPSRIFSMVVHPCEDKLIVAVGDKWGALGIWDVNDKSSKKHGVEVFYPHSRPINCMTIDTTNTNKFVTTSYDGTVRSFDLEAQKVSLIYGTAEDDSTYTGYHCQVDANTYLVTLGSTSLVGLVDTRESNLRRSRDFKLFERGSAKTVSVHPIKRHLILCPNNRGECPIFDIRAKTKMLSPVSSLHGHTKAISSAFFSPITGHSVVTVSYDNKLRIYDVTAQEKIMPRKQISHNNQTGRWLTTFKAEWHPRREDMFFVGSMDQPRKIDVFNSENGNLVGLKGEHLTSICSIVKGHPTQDIVVGGNASGRVFCFM